MKTRLQLLLCTLVVALCAHHSASADTNSFTLNGPLSPMVMTGATVLLTFTPPAAPTNFSLPLRYQWRKDGNAIGCGTNASHTLHNVTMNDAATYTVVLSGKLELESAPLHLSVYALFTNQSNGGYLATPVGDFTQQPGSTVCSGSSTAFNKYKVFMPFDGPNTTPPSVAFPNLSNEGNLLVSTCTNLNGPTLNTTVQIVENFTNMTELACNDNAACGPNTKLSDCAAIGLLSGQTYRVIIYHRSQTLGTPPLTKIHWRWKYTNGTTW